MDIKVNKEKIKMRKGCFWELWKRDFIKYKYIYKSTDLEKILCYSKKCLKRKV